jgi:hypothetical protein
MLGFPNRPSWWFGRVAGRRAISEQLSTREGKLGRHACRQGQRRNQRERGATRVYLDTVKWFSSVVAPRKQPSVKQCCEVALRP